MYNRFVMLLFLVSLASFSQNLTGTQLLNKAIEYHDPNNNWPTFNGELFVTTETPNNPKRVSKIIINLPKAYFYLSATKNDITSEYVISKDSCSLGLNGDYKVDEATLKVNNISCERANLYKNYYTYLYGLPMKLKDQGSIVHNKVEQKNFKGKDYLVLKVTYNKAVGSDVWYFYFNPKTYAMEVYQFFKTDDKGDVKPDSGEYILLTEEKTINTIKIPKNRAWYYNKDDGYLGTDILKQ
jgi:hypothetical protein